MVHHCAVRPILLQSFPLLPLKNDSPHFEVQLLHYRNPDAIPDPHIRDLNQMGFNHLCFQSTTSAGGCPAQGGVYPPHV